MATAPTNETVEHLIRQHSLNVVINVCQPRPTDHSWASRYKMLHRLHVHTKQLNGMTTANFHGAFLDPLEDDKLRLREPAGRRPPEVPWLLQTEAGIRDWFNTEVSNVVLAAFRRFPAMRQQSEPLPRFPRRYPPNIDETYRVTFQGQALTVAIGKIQCNRIKANQWKQGLLDTMDQQNLSRELRAYAYIYECPQIFCFDGSTFLMLQFRARDVQHIKDPTCEVDCWVLPVVNFGGTTLRSALYRLLVQGMRRCQGIVHRSPSLKGSAQLVRRDLYSGLPVFKPTNGGVETHYPHLWFRLIDVEDGSFRWWSPNEENIADGVPPLPIYDTAPIWKLDAEFTLSRFRSLHH